MVSVKFALVLRLAGVSGEGGAAAPRKNIYTTCGWKVRREVWGRQSPRKKRISEQNRMHGTEKILSRVPSGRNRSTIVQYRLRQ